MNKNNARDYLPLVQALAEGKVIQASMSHSGEWYDHTSPDFTMQPDRYRIKPEPREIWYNRYESGIESGPYRSKEKAIEGAHHEYKFVQVCYREVIE